MIEVYYDGDRYNPRLRATVPGMWVAEWVGEWDEEPEEGWHRPPPVCYGRTEAEARNALHAQLGDLTS